METRRPRDLDSAREMRRNMLPLNKEIIWHYDYLRTNLREVDANFQKKVPNFTDVKSLLLEDIIGIWKRASLPIVGRNRVETKIKVLIEKWNLCKKKARKSKYSNLHEEWMDQLFDISKCKCSIDLDSRVVKGKVLCSCPFENRIPAVELQFLLDQRRERKMIISWIKDKKFEKRAKERMSRVGKNKISEVASSKKNSKDLDMQCVTATRLRKRKSNESNEKESEKSDEDIVENGNENRQDPDFMLRPVQGGKKYVKVKSKLSLDSCMLADRRMTSIRQQSEQLLSLEGTSIAASPTTVFYNREKTRMRALQEAEQQLNACTSLQLCYDGRVVNKSDRYVFLGQCVDASNAKKEAVIGVKSYPPGKSVTSDVLFKTITQECCEALLPKIYSVMADTTAVNTGKKSGVNKRITDLFDENVDHNVHVLECLFHEIYFSHVVSFVEGRKKGPGVLQDGALLNEIKKLTKKEVSDIPSRDTILEVPITGLAKLHLKAKLEWFAELKKDPFAINKECRSDQLCLLVLACFTFMDVPANLKPLLKYKQESICHSRWITTASGYLRLFLFKHNTLSAIDVAKLKRLVSYIISVYVPSFIMIHLNPRACDGPYLNLFQRDLLIAFQEIDIDVADVVFKYFVEHGSQWMSSENVALSLYSDSPPMSLDAVKTSISLPAAVNISAQLRSRSARLKSFFTVQSKTAPCVVCTNVPAAFWRVIDNNNRSTESRQA